MPTDGLRASLLLVLLATPLLIPWNVVGTIWQIYARPDIGLLGVTLNELGIAFNYTAEPLHAWLTLLAMDIWHWTSLVALLAFAGLTSVPAACYQAAELDGASKWQVFRFVELPRLKGCVGYRRTAALNGQLYDLYRTLRSHWWRPGQYHHIPESIFSDYGSGSI